MYEDMQTRNREWGFIFIFISKSKNLYSDFTEANLDYCSRPKNW